MSSYNAHDDRQPATSRLMQITASSGYETLMEVRSDFETISTLRWGELRITQEGIRMTFEIYSPVKAI